MLLFHISFQIDETPTGGGNQFLRALRNELKRRGVYTPDGRGSDIVIFNSFQNIPRTLKLRQANPNAIFIHRVDGPIRLYNRLDDPRDELVIRANALISDATIFQSKWSYQANIELGWPIVGPATTIGNAADPEIFRPRERRSPGQPLRVIAASWSSNANKGYDVYTWFDTYADQRKYQLTLAGNTPVAFKNVRTLGALTSAALAVELVKNDVYLTASRRDPCSNSLVEALTVGLPAVAFNDGGHPELVAEGGFLFEHPAQIPEMLDQIATNYDVFRARIRIPTISEIADAYIDFARELQAQRVRGMLPIKKLGRIDAAIASWQFRRH